MVETDGFPHDLVMRGDHAIVAEGDSGLQILDITDPNRVRRVGSHPTEGEALRVIVQGDLAHVVSQVSDGPSELNRGDLES